MNNEDKDNIEFNQSNEFNKDKETIKFDQCNDLTKLDKGEYSYSVPVGPTNVALHEPIRFFFEVEGEIVRDVDIKPGWVHRGIEKIATKRNAVQIAPLVQRVCGICSTSHPYAYTRAMEDAADIKVPERAQYIRAITEELERIHSHMLWAGSTAHEMGFESLFYYIWKEREEVMDALEALSGNRVTYEMFIVGGVRRDINDYREKNIRKAIKHYEEILEKVNDTMLDDPSVKMRTRDIGILNRENAIKLAAQGPTARGTSIDRDVRKDQAHSAYADIDFEPITPDRLLGETRGDCFDRLLVRLREVEQSVNLIKTFLDDLPEGKTMAHDNMNLLLSDIESSEGEGIGRIEAPRGELLYYVNLEEGKEEPSAFKIRTPTYGNLMSLIPMFMGDQIADIPVIGATIDPCMSCMDRVTIINKDTGNKKIYSKEDLIEKNKNNKEGKQ